MDSVNDNTPPPEINKCNILYKNEEYYSKSVSSDNYKEYNYSNDEYSYSCLSSSILIIIICIILIYSSVNKSKENKSIIFYIITTVLLCICAIFSGLIALVPSYIAVPKDLTRPCYSSKVNAILYSDEQLIDIYMKK